MVLRFLVVFLLMAGMGFSQSFTGFIDGYYGGNFNKPPSRTNGFRAFDLNHNEFSLNYAELAVEQKPAPVGFRVDIGFGDAASVVHALEPSPVAFYQHLQQAYLSASHGKLTIDFGKYVTQHGAEVIEDEGQLELLTLPALHMGYSVLSLWRSSNPRCERQSDAWGECF